MRRRVLAVLAAGLLALLAWAVVIPGAPVRVEIPEGLSARQTAELLARERVVASSLALRVFLRLTGFERRLMPGSYLLRVNEWPTTVVRRLTLGLTDDVKVVIPEGLRAAQIAERLAAAGAADAREFQDLAASRRLEGRLFPSTYRLVPGGGAKRAAARMTEEFERRIGAAYAAARPAPALTLEQALTLASIVEREAVLPQERPIIAAVYLNRLKRRMPLQADPTVQYALGHWKRRLSTDDLRIDSPYNTYRRPGLPPGPICSPGLGSFQAVLRPADTRALYFVADAHGGHIFSESNEEHSEARRLYKRELRKLKARPAPGPPAPR
ncbi:MAG: endolytic transglycosylase MltG [Elusimicrobia bacterium]|nr:endolytic transglycosylase MltG [Elusimicrobiota bacterium]